MRSAALTRLASPVPRGTSQCPAPPRRLVHLENASPGRAPWERPQGEHDGAPDLPTSQRGWGRRCLASPRRARTDLRYQVERPRARWRTGASKMGPRIPRTSQQEWGPGPPKRERRLPVPRGTPRRPTEGGGETRRGGGARRGTRAAPIPHGTPSPGGRALRHRRAVAAPLLAPEVGGPSPRGARRRLREGSRVRRDEAVALGAEPEPPRFRMERPYPVGERPHTAGPSRRRSWRPRSGSRSRWNPKTTTEAGGCDPARPWHPELHPRRP